jgi:glutamate-1-semialdehyde aminotransferase
LIYENPLIQWKYNINAIVEICGNKGSLFFYKAEYKKPKNYNDYYNYKCDIMEALFVKYMLNRGILIQVRDEWSISLQHTDDHINKFISEFELFCKMIQK